MFRIVLKLRIPVILVLSAATLFFATQLPTLKLDPDTEAYVPKGHPMRVYWQEARQRFGIGREILVAIQTDHADGVFAPEILRGLTELTDGIKALPSVIEADVSSLADAEAIVGTEDGLEVEPFFSEPPVNRGIVMRASAVSTLSPSNNGRVAGTPAPLKSKTGGSSKRL